MNINIRSKDNEQLKIYIKYSFYPDGTNFTNDHIEGQKYQGTAVSAVEPVDKEKYVWTLIPSNTINDVTWESF